MRICRTLEENTMRTTGAVYVARPFAYGYCNDNSVERGTRKTLENLDSQFDKMMRISTINHVKQANRKLTNGQMESAMSIRPAIVNTPHSAFNRNKINKIDEEELSVEYLVHHFDQV